jgi:hypothetical protein
METRNPVSDIYKMLRSMLQGGPKVKNDREQGKGIMAYNALCYVW